MIDQEDWSTDANDAFKISFVQAGKTSLASLSTFHPHFTYPIFGDQERIFGYQGLALHLRFAAHDLHPNLEISYDKRFKPVGDTKATDLLEILKEWTPAETFEKAAAFDAHVQNDLTAKSFKPPGTLLESYSSRGRQFEIWCGEVTDPAVRLILARMQILISFFIEGGTPLYLDDQEWTLARWRVYMVYEKLSDLPAPNASAYSIVGYSTSYRFVTYLPNSTPSAAVAVKDFTFPPTSPLLPSDLPARARISQFLILPSHHSHGHGTHLYNAMVSTFLASPTCTEITVEDPNEAFDDLRDYCDYNRLLANGTFGKIEMNSAIDPKLSQRRIGVRVPTNKLLNLPLLEALRRENKIAPRQFARMVEMYLFSKIAVHSRQAGSARLTRGARSTDPDDRTFYYWRLLVKQRVFKKNKDVLMQLDQSERVDKVEQTVGEVAGDYERLLRELENFKDGKKVLVASVDGEKAIIEGEGSSGMGRKDRLKRKMVVREHEESDDEDEEMDSGTLKRARSEAL